MLMIRRKRISIVLSYLAIIKYFVIRGFVAPKEIVSKLSRDTLIFASWNDDEFKSIKLLSFFLFLFLLIN